MTRPLESARRASTLRVRPIPETAPAVLTAPAFEESPPTPFVQGTLAVDFDPEYCDGYFAVQPTRSQELPEPRAWVGHIAQALVEVMTGVRPAPQVVRWTSPEVYAGLTRRASRHLASRRGAGERRAVVRTVRVCEPADGVLEACAVVVLSGRVRALAMRLVGQDRRWVVTELQVG